MQPKNLSKCNPAKQTKKILEYLTFLLILQMLLFLSLLHFQSKQCFDTLQFSKQKKNLH